MELKNFGPGGWAITEGGISLGALLV